MGSVWSDFLPKREYDRTFGVAKFRDATEPSPEEKQSWVQDAIKKFREATQAAEEKKTNLLAAKQREETKVPAVQPLGIEARAIPKPRAPITADIQKFREATAPTEAATRLHEKVHPLGLERLAGKRWTPAELESIEQYRRGEITEDMLNELLRGSATATGLPGLNRILGPELSRPEYIASLPVGGWSGIVPGAAGLLGMRGAEVVSQKYNLPPAAAIPLQLGAGLVAGMAGAKLQGAALRGAAKVAASPEIAAFRRGILKTVSEEAGGAPLGPRVPEEPVNAWSIGMIEKDLQNLRRNLALAEAGSPKVKGSPEAWRQLITEKEAELAGLKGATAPEPVSADIASFRAATEITPGMSKAERLAQWKAGYKPETPAGGVPPTEPPTAPPGQPPTGGLMPERGYTGAQEIIDTKEATLLRPGKATQVPLVWQGLSVLNPSVTQERTVLVAYNARRAAGVSLETAWNARRAPLIDELTAAWKETPAKYIGPPDRPDVLKGTLADFGQNPADYTGATPRLKQAVEGYKAHQDAILAEARGKYGVDIQPYPVQPGGFFVPNVATKESLETAAGTLSSNYTSASLASKFGTAKTRLYESAAKRMAHDPTFVPETNIGTLADLHDAALARMAGNETFKLGAGGKMRLEVMQETHPKLANQMLTLRQRLQSLRGTAGRLDQKLDDTVRSFLDNPDEMPLSDLADSLDVRITRGPNVGKSAAEINAEIQAVRQAIRQIRPAWENASIDPYVMNRKTFRYYTREQSAAIDKILTTRLPIGQGIVDVIDEIRVTTFGGDISPLTIQGLLGATADPVTLAFNARGIGRTLASGRTLEELTRAEPELVRRYTIATGRPLGQLGAEFRQAAKGPERIPGLGRAWALVNDRTMGAVEYLRYQAWKNDSNLLQKLGGKTQAVADAEAANTWSKIMPALAPEERGASALQAQLERTPIISSSFAAGPPALIKDAVSGLAKLGGSRELSPIARWQGLAGREQLAVLRLTTMTGTLATLTTLSYIAAGDSPEEAAKKVLNPATGRFMSIATGKQGYIPIGGPFRSLIRGLAPRYVDGKLVPFAGTLQFLRGKEVPPLATITDLIRGQDFMGRQIVQGDFPQNLLSGLWYAAERHMPLTGGAVSEKIRTGEAKLTDIGTLAREAGTQLLGVNFYETSVWDKRDEARDKAAQQKFGRSWGDLNRGQQDEVRAATPEVVQLETKATETGAGRGFNYSQRTEAYQKVKDEKAEQGERLLDADPTGKQWVVWRKDTGTRLDQEWDSLTRQFNITEEPREPDKVEDQFAERYWNVEPDANNDGMISDAEGLQFDTDRKAILAEARAVGVSEDYIKVQYRGRMWKNNPRLQAIEEEYQQAKDIAAEWYSIPAKRGYSTEEEAELAPWADQAAAIGGAPGRALSTLGLDPDLASRVLRYMHSPDNPARARFWRQNKEKKALKDKFYKDIPISLPAEELAGVR